MLFVEKTVILLMVVDYVWNILVLHATEEETVSVVTVEEEVVVVGVALEEGEGVEEEGGEEEDLKGSSCQSLGSLQLDPGRISK